MTEETRNDARRVKIAFVMDVRVMNIKAPVLLRSFFALDLRLNKLKLFIRQLRLVNKISKLFVVV